MAPAVAVTTLRGAPIPSRYASTPPLLFAVNTTRVSLSPHELRTHIDDTLLDFLRARGLTGTKLGCGEGGCGACTVVLVRPRHGDKEARLEARAVNACLFPLVACHGAQVLTVEGIGSTAAPHPIQQRLAACFGSQCGFCTPGIVMAFYALLRNSNGKLSERDVERGMDGNLCRCTAYRPILDALKTFATLPTPTSSAGSDSDGEASGSSPPTTPEEQEDADALAELARKSPCAMGDACCRVSGRKEACGSAGTGAAGDGHFGTEAATASADPSPATSATATWRSSKLPLLPSSGSAARELVGKSGPEGFALYEGREPIFPPWLAKAHRSAAQGKPLSFSKTQPCDEQDLVFVTQAAQAQVESDSDEEDDDEAATAAAATSAKSSTIWLRPGSVQALVSTLAFYAPRGGAKIRAGDSEARIETRFGGRVYDVSVQVGPHLAALTTFEQSERELSIGANLPLSDVRAAVEAVNAKCGSQDTKPEAVYARQVRTAVLHQTAHFAGTAVRNVACIGGNVATASPISDLNPLWLALDAELGYIDAAEIASAGDEASQLDDCALVKRFEKKLRMRDFFKGYRKTALPAHGILTRVIVPLPKLAEGETMRCRAWKHAKRRDDDISIVCGAGLVRIDAAGNVKDVALAYGGLAPTTELATHAQDALRGKAFNDAAALEEALRVMAQKDFPLAKSVPGGMPAYRKALALGALVRFWKQAGATTAPLDLPALQELTDEHAMDRPLTRGTQSYEDVEVSVPGGSGAALKHLSSLAQTTGEAEYCDDLPHQANELYGALVLTTRALARIKRIDASPALGPGLATHWVCAEDVKRMNGSNIWSPPAMDELFFVEEKVTSYAQIIGVVLAESKREAQRAAKLVVVEYEDLGKPILTIDEAIAANSFFPYAPKLQLGPDEAFEDWSDCHVVEEGTTRIGGAEHFYLETNACLIVPDREDDIIEVHSSTQNPSETQTFVASVLNVPANRVHVKVRRIGGGFGGKESRSIMLAATMAVAAKAARRPVRVQLDRDEDMAMTGQRHPFMGKWRIGADADGKLRKLDLQIFNNAGHTQDLSRAVLERAMFHCEGSCSFEHLRVVGRSCRTNTCSNTAFRGFGGPQGMIVAEAAIDAVARRLGVGIETIKARNQIREGEISHYGQPRVDWNVPRMWEQLRVSGDWDARRAAVDEWNRTHRWLKRGLHMSSTSFGIAFTAKFLNQAYATIHIYHADGSVMLSHGGVEMGQGLHTKLAQICATELDVPVELIHIQHTSTREAANTSASAASASTDLNGMAVKHACEQLNATLAPYRKNGVAWKDACHAAYFAREQLSAVGHFRTPDLHMDWATGTGTPFSYWTQGVCINEVLVDVLTGEARVTQLDIVMDIARSINPGVDIGQICGAAAQGFGMVTLEESLWTQAGKLITVGPGSYKIPAFNDTPTSLNVSFMRAVDGRKTHHLRTIQGSRGVGEPPLVIGCFTLFAIKDAIASARRDAGLGTGPFELRSPATPEVVRLACGDALVQLATQGTEGKPGEKSWSVAIS